VVCSRFLQSGHGFRLFLLTVETKVVGFAVLFSSIATRPRNQRLTKLDFDFLDSSPFFLHITISSNSEQ
jgi:hypothetical protein